MTINKITTLLLLSFIGVCFVISCAQRGIMMDKIITEINKNHAETLTMIKGSYKTEAEFLKSLKKAKINRNTKRNTGG